MQRDPLLRRLFSGLLGGIAGTTAMTAAMEAMHRRLPPDERHPLPPRHVSMSVASKSGLGPPEREDDRVALTLAMHYAYGTTLGAVYGLVAPQTRWAPLVAGLPFGFAVWAGSYLGLLPALGLHPPATRESAPRNSLMIAAHFVWAGTIAAVVETTRGDRQPE
jgi:uncharacterized membrane protein YagU involved in acid resistance